VSGDDDDDDGDAVDRRARRLSRTHTFTSCCRRPLAHAQKSTPRVGATGARWQGGKNVATLIN